MNNQHIHVNTSVSQTLETVEQRVNKGLTASYRAPQLFVIGTAVELLQSFRWGGYQDTYTGYYWNR